MGAKATTKKVKIIGKKKFVDVETNEIQEMQVISVEEHDFNFHKLWLRNILTTLDLISNQKMKLAFWIIEHLDYENKLTYTFRQIQEETGISLDTISRTMKILIECDFIKRKNGGCYIVNPDILYKGNNQTRMNVLIQYH
jgi:DNA-binding HxlR family transcriptional regulator